jgi:hypothetical protein
VSSSLIFGSFGPNFIHYWPWLQIMSVFLCTLHALNKGVVSNYG